MKDHTWYLAGPMTGYPKFNFPAFIDAASALRVSGFSIISPAELDASSDIADKALASDSGDLIDAGITQTWGDLLARDVKLITDEVSGIIFLPGWEKSRGARLEAFVGLLCGRDFARYVPGGNIERMHAHAILTQLSRATFEGLRDAG